MTQPAILLSFQKQLCNSLQVCSSHESALLFLLVMRLDRAFTLLFKNAVHRVAAKNQSAFASLHA